MALDHLARHRAFDVAAAFHRQVDDHRSGSHRRQLRIADQPRRGAAGDQRGGDDDILLGDMRGYQLGLCLLVFLAHLGRIAARTLALDPGDILDEDRLGAQRQDLFLRRGSHVGGGYLRAQPPRGGDRLQPGDAHAHHEHLGGADRARRGHHHRKGAAIDARGVQHRLVPRQVRLRRQDVHRLRTRDARHELHRQRLVPRRGIGVDPRAVPEGVQPGDDPGARRRAGQRRGVRPLHAQHDARARQRRRPVAHVGPRRGVIAVGIGCAGAGSGLDRHLRAQRHEFLHRFRRRGHPALAGSPLLKDRDLHAALRKSAR